MYKRQTADFFQERGLILPWYAEIDHNILPIEREVPSDADRKLNWMRTQVKPALRWLIENGYRAEAMRELGAEFVHWTRHDTDDEYIWRFPYE